MANLYWPRREQFQSESRRRQRFLAQLDDAERRAGKVLLVSHGQCLDGAASVVVTLRVFDEGDVGVAYCQPSDMQRVLEHLGRHEGRGRTLMIADLSLNPNQYDAIVRACARLKSKGWRIEWRDHHHKQWEGLDVDRILEHVDVVEVNDDATESGASLQQQALARRDRFAKRFADTVKDRDLWWNQNPDSETLEYAINGMGEEAFIRHFVAKGAKDPVVDAAVQRAADRERHRTESAARRLAGQARLYGTRDGEKVAIVYGWLPKNVGLHRVLEQDGVQVAVNVRPNGHMSLRSRKGADVCQEVAKEFDGGGHPNASGGTLDLKGLRYWWYVLRRGRTRRVQEVARVGVERLEARRREVEQEGAGRAGEGRRGARRRKG